MKRKREARDSLERARSQFGALGTPLWVARADRALARIGGRSASPTELSETERRVAEVVAEGLTNKEAAERLFMSVKTVESNLRRVYRKLGVRSARSSLVGIPRLLRIARHPPKPTIKRRVPVVSSAASYP